MGARAAERCASARILATQTAMSEYQYYEFQAIDRRLTAEEQATLRRSSTRAKITATSFVNEYDWGSFKGDVDGWMDRYFDAFLHFAHWGTRVTKLRLPSKLLDEKTARLYCVGDRASVRKTGEHVILTFALEDEGGGDEDSDSQLASLIGVREELARGDLRALYLGWLACVQSEELDEDEREPEVPPGLAALSAAQSSLAEFLQIDTDLIAAAAKESAALATDGPTPAAVRAWVAKLPVAEKNTLLARVIVGDVQVSRELDRRMRKETTRDAPTKAAKKRRTVGELSSEYERIAEERKRAERAREAKRKAQQAREQQAARDKHLAAIAGSELSLWTRAEAHIAKKLPKEYDAAVALIVDLRDLAERSETRGEFDRRVEEMCEKHRQKRGFIERLEKAGV
ncbi:MAG: hypothetical protein JNK05_39570 [Myxococcales bacterium]|nr:hypothetical protein [Myxococcales bacterium]